MTKLKESMSRRSLHGRKISRWVTHQEIKAEARRLRAGRKVQLRKRLAD